MAALRAPVAGGGVSWIVKAPLKSLRALGSIVPTQPLEIDGTGSCRCSEKPMPGTVVVQLVEAAMDAQPAAGGAFSKALRLDAAPDSGEFGLLYSEVRSTPGHIGFCLLNERR